MSKLCCHDEELLDEYQAVQAERDALKTEVERLRAENARGFYPWRRIVARQADQLAALLNKLRDREAMAVVINKARWEFGAQWLHGKKPTTERWTQEVINALLAYLLSEQP